ncbi:MAG: type II secretion system protein [Burkholderiales bacterium]
MAEHLPGQTCRQRDGICRTSALERGISLIELVMFIMIISIGIAGLLLVFSTTTRRSADPLIQKQMLSMAEALLEEVQSKPFTYCDPDDAGAATAGAAVLGAGNCQTTVEVLGPEAGEISRATFDNVSDYNGLSLAPVTDIAGNTIASLASYSASIALAAVGLGGVPAADALQITVTVTGPGSSSLSVQGFRTRYAPNALP